MKNSKAICIICSEEIRNPMCIGCMENEESILEAEDEILRMKRGSQDRCMICGANVVICYLCYLDRTSSSRQDIIDLETGIY